MNDYDPKIKQLLELLDGLPEKKFVFDERYGRAFRLDDILVVHENPTDRACMLAHPCYITLLGSATKFFTDYGGEVIEPEQTTTNGSYPLDSDCSWALHELMQKLLRYDVDQLLHHRRRKKKPWVDPTPEVDKALGHLHAKK